MLVEAGANINATGYDKRTALLGALERNPNLDIARYLIEAGADVKARDNRGNTTLLHLTSQMVDAPDIVKMLIDRGVDINAKNASCKTAYGLAGACGLENTRKLLVKAGHKDITVKTSCEKYSKFIPRRPCRIK
jgi:ankyrin repeat protein